MLQKEKSPVILSSKHLNVDFFRKKENIDFQRLAVIQFMQEFLLK